MNTRKDRLKSLFGGADGTGGEAPSPASFVPAEPPARRTTSGAVKSMGLSLGSLSQEVEEARRLREALVAGERVVELDPAMLERSPFLDRFSEGPANDEAFEELTRSLAEHGQQVPILVRPHPDPDRAGRGLYQIAYGHRRVQAARALGRPVRAVVRNLGDADLAVAQGKENAERRALSFIERAFFAKTLLDHGFDRATAQSALSVHKSEMSRLLQVAETVPLEIVRAIGPAPKAGRPRWLALGELLAKDSAGFAQDEITCQPFREADSDTRFQRLFDRLKAAALRRAAKPRTSGRSIKDESGRAIGELAKAGQAMRLTIPESAGKGFADFLAARLPQLHAEFRQAGQEGRSKED